MKRSGIVVFGAMLFFAQAVSAQFVPVDPTRQPVDGDLLRYVGTYPGSPIAYNVYTGPYQGALASSPTTPTFTMYCVDFNHHVSSTPWAINVSGGLGAGADVSQTRLAGRLMPNALLVYQQSAFLASMFASDRSNWAGIHGAIWALTGGLPGSYVTNTVTPLGNVNDPDFWLQYLRTAEGVAAFGAFAASSARYWYVMTPTAAYDAAGNYTNLGNQEFLVHVTPEPSTYVLLISGLLLVGFVARRRIREAGYL